MQIKRIPSHPNYAITCEGSVINLTSGRILSQHSATSKRSGRLYSKVKLYRDGKRKAFFVHRLVAQAYVPNPERLATVDHKNFNTINNHYTNLRWLSREANAVRHKSKQ